MSLELAPISLTDFITVTISLAGSLVLAYFTSKREMKKRVFEERLKIYRTTFSFFRDLRRDSEVRSSPSTLRRLSDLEIDITMLGTEELIAIMQNLKERLEETITSYNDARTEQSTRVDNELEHLISEEGLNPSTATIQLENEWNDNNSQVDYAASLVMQDEEIDRFTVVAIEEMRRSLTQRKGLHFTTRIRKAQIDKKLNPKVE